MNEIDDLVPGQDLEYYLRERYAADRADSHLLTLYYALRPLVPRRLQLALRRIYARRQAVRRFPAWPIEPVLVEREHQRFRELVRASDAAAVPFVNYWPRACCSCLLLTHDVEGERGIENISRVLEIERRYGFVSAWYFVAQDYRIPVGLFDELRAAGCEIGLHGIHHDGKLFQSREHFEAELPTIQRYLHEWDAVGFRSPSLHRNADWMTELGAVYDSSFPDTDPFEPQPGGCCSIFPYHLADVVELPITLVQDHTLFEILRDVSTRRWIEKARWIIENHGMVNLLVHPDYLRSDQRLAVYEEFLGWLAGQERFWHVLPHEAAAWWRARSELERNPDPCAAVAARPELQATVAHAHLADGRIVIVL